MKLELHQKDNKISNIEISDSWNIEYNRDLVHQVVTAELAGRRQGTKAQKNRGSLTRSNRKPHQQKGSGKARAGDSKGPLWRSGGVTFAQRDVRDYSMKVNKKMRKQALKVILSELVRENKITVVSDDFFAMDKPKTKEMSVKLAPFDISKCLIIASEVDLNTELSLRNIPTVRIIKHSQINSYDLIRSSRIVITQSALAKIEEERLA